MSTQSFNVEKRTVKIGTADNVLFPDVGTTKANPADCYARIADTMLPHLAGRLIFALDPPTNDFAARRLRLLRHRSGVRP